MLDLAHIHSREVDHQRMYFLTPSQWEQAEKEEKVGSLPIRNLFMNLIKEILLYCIKYEQLSLGLGPFGVKAEEWYPYVILNLDGIDQRVFLESIVCSNCHHRMMIANASVFEIYFGIPDDIDKYRIMREAKKFERRVCTNCGGELSRPAIWVGEILNNS
jgi:hypothetical protein